MSGDRPELPLALRCAHEAGFGVVACVEVFEDLDPDPARPVPRVPGPHRHDRQFEHGAGASRPESVHGTMSTPRSRFPATTGVKEIGS